LATRHVTVSITAALLVCFLPQLSLRAQDQQPPDAAGEIENARQSFIGQINANAVYVQSGAGQNHYPTMKLDKGDRVTVVGMKFDWLKITPPKDSFSYVGKVFVERSGDGSSGRVTRPDVRVRAGSSLNEFKAAIQGELEQGQEVQIVGEKDEYFMIKPPPGAFVYVHKQFVDPVGPADGAGAAAETPLAGGAGVITTPTEAGQTGQQPMAAETAASDVPVEQPVATETPAATPSTRPSAAEARFDELEAEFAAASELPIDQQPLAEMRTKYQDLLADATLPESMRRIAEFRMQAITLRGDAQAELAALKQSREQADQRQMTMTAEQDELAEQIKKNNVTVFTAVGSLQTSSLQQGKQTLYRLTDPNTGRTVVYVRSNDSQVAGHMGQFVGVRGELGTDPQLSLKVITPTAVEQVNPSELYRTVAAQVVPPSMLPKAQGSVETPAQ
jgi:hypothetical protein